MAENYDHTPGPHHVNQWPGPGQFYPGAMRPEPPVTLEATIYGMDRSDYMRKYPHSSHLADEVGVFNSQCESCQAHFREAFGEPIAALMTRLSEVTDHTYWPHVFNEWYGRYGPQPADDIVDAEIIEDGQ
jgi:hypothetical protein